MRALKLTARIDHDRAFDPSDHPAAEPSVFIDGSAPPAESLSPLESFRESALNLARDAVIPRGDYQNPCGSLKLRAGAGPGRPLHELVVLFEQESRLPEFWKVDWTLDAAAAPSMVFSSAAMVLSMIEFLILDSTSRWLGEVSFRQEPGAAGSQTGRRARRHGAVYPFPPRSGKPRMTPKKRTAKPI